MTDTMLSRSGRTAPEGKLTDRLDVPVSEELKDAVIALAAVAGVPKAEYVRGIIERAVYGDLSLLRRVARPMSPGRWDEFHTTGGFGG